MQRVEKPGRTRGTFGPITVLLVLSALFATPLHQLQTQLGELQSKVTAEQSIRYLPSGRFLSMAVMGFDNLAADLLWVRGIGLFGEHFKATQDEQWFVWLFQLIDLATEMDPRDVRIYKYGGLMLRLDRPKVDQSTYIFAKGMEHCPDEFFLPFGVAMNYLELKQDPLRAAEYMRIASVKPNAPFYLRSLAATILDKAQQGDAALAFLEEQLSSLEPGSLPFRAVQVKIEEVKHNNAARGLLSGLNEFLSRFNRIPQPLEEMQGITFHGDWPRDPYGGHFVIEPLSGRLQSSEWARVRERIRQETGLGGEESHNANPRQ